MININANFLQILKRKRFAFAFNGIDNLIDINNLKNLLEGNADGFIEVSINTNALTHSTILGATGDINSFRFRTLPTGALSFLFNDNSQFLTSTTLVNDNQDHIVKIQQKNNRLSLIVDGTEEDGINQNFWFWSFGSFGINHLQIGAYLSTMNFIGEISTINISNKIIFNFNEGKGNQVKEEVSGQYYTIQGAFTDEQWIKL